MYVTTVNKSRGDEFEKEQRRIWESLEEEREGRNDVTI